VTVDPAGRGIAGTMSCPRCAAPVGSDQDWCLACGAAARTRLAPTPNWRAPVVALAVVALLACIALVAAFVALTNDSTPPAATTAAPPAATTAAPAATTTAPPAATTAVPPAATTAPPATTTTP
jgi:hypothetical protein